MSDKYAVLASYAQHMVDTGRDVAPFTSREIIEMLAERDADRARIAELEETVDLQRGKIRRLESDLWDEQQLRKVHSQKSFELENENRELKFRNDKDFVWRGEEISRLNDELDALREGEMGDAKHSNTRAAADIYFQLVEECEIPSGGSLVEHIDDMRERITELEAQASAHDRLCDSNYLAGLTVGWNFGIVENSDGFNQCHAARARRWPDDDISLKIEGE